MLNDCHKYALAINAKGTPFPTEPLSLSLDVSFGSGLASGFDSVSMSSPPPSYSGICIRLLLLHTFFGESLSLLALY